MPSDTARLAEALRCLEERNLSTRLAASSTPADFFGELLDRAWELHGSNEGEGSDSAPWSNRTFVDIGSGAGRLVFAAAALHPEMKLCRGLEILPTLHDVSTTILDGCLSEDAEVLRVPLDGAPPGDGDDNTGYHLRLAPVKFTLGSFTDPYEYLGEWTRGNERTATPGNGVHWSRI